VPASSRRAHRPLTRTTPVPARARVRRLRSPLGDRQHGVFVAEEVQLIIEKVCKACLADAGFLHSKVRAPPCPQPFARAHHGARPAAVSRALRDARRRSGSARRLARVAPPARRSGNGPRPSSKTA
jgi:hypothetical protein